MKCLRIGVLCKLELLTVHAYCRWLYQVMWWTWHVAWIIWWRWSSLSYELEMPRTSYCFPFWWEFSRARRTDLMGEGHSRNSQTFWYSRPWSAPWSITKLEYLPFYILEQYIHEKGHEGDCSCPTSVSLGFIDLNLSSLNVIEKQRNQFWHHAELILKEIIFSKLPINDQNNF